MGKLYVNELNISLSLDECIKRLNVDEDFAEEFEEVFESCMAVAKPMSCFKEVEVIHKESTTVVDGHEITSKIMHKNFEAVNRAFPYVVTSGRELYELAEKESDPLTKYWMESIAECVLTKAFAENDKIFKGIYNIAEFSAMNPGSLKDFPITNQKALFESLDNCEAIGVKLTESCLMLPKKTVSGYFFETKEHYVNCEFCPREDCPNRRKPFNEEKLNAQYGL